MRRARLTCGTVLLAFGAAVFLSRPVPPAQDRHATLALPEDRPLRLTLLGTSLSHEEIWPDSLRQSLQAQLNHPVALSTVTQPGAGSLWGLEQTERVAALSPDWVLIEFAINDADILDGQGLSQAHHTHVTLVHKLRSLLPEVDIVLMTMSPAQGLRGLLRLQLAAHYRQYRELAGALDLGLVDLYPRWLALPRAARGIQVDGLHPEAQVAADLIVPVLTEYLSQRATRPGSP